MNKNKSSTSVETESEECKAVVAVGLTTNDVKATPFVNSTHIYQKPKKHIITAGLPCFIFLPPSSQPKGLLLLAPGSWGGMGPGQSSEKTRGIFSLKIHTIYSEMAAVLSQEFGYLVSLFTWRKPPSRRGAPIGTLRSPQTLLEGAADVQMAGKYLRKYAATVCSNAKDLPMVLVGFSFGGPSVLAASKQTLDESSSLSSASVSLLPLAGVITIGTGFREDQGAVVFNGLDSHCCAAALSVNRIPLCLLCGLADRTVPPEWSQDIFRKSGGPKAAVWLEGASHHMISRLPAATEVLLRWVPALFESYDPATKQSKGAPWLWQSEAAVM